MHFSRLFKIKEGKKGIWYAWCSEIETRIREEAIASLIEEKVVQELTLGFSAKDSDYVIGFMDGECLPANMSRELNLMHKRKKEECLERVSEVSILYNLKT